MRSPTFEVLDGRRGRQRRFWIPGFRVAVVVMSTSARGTFSEPLRSGSRRLDRKAGVLSVQQGQAHPLKQKRACASKKDMTLSMLRTLIELVNARCDWLWNGTKQRF